MVRRDEFVAEMDYLTARGYRAITALEMALCLSSDFPSQLRQSILLTFDDAYTDFYACVLPVLQRYGLIATVYFSTAYVGRTARRLETVGEQDRKLLSWQALREIASEGIEVASHSHGHPQIDRAHKAIAKEEARHPGASLRRNLGFR